MTVIQSKSKKTARKPQQTAKKPIKAVTGKVVPAGKKTPPVKRANPKPKQAGEKFEPNADQRNLVTLAMGIGMTKGQACALIVNPETNRPISIHTLEKHFPDELADGKARVMAKVAGNLVSIASDKKHKNTVTAAIFFLKTQAKWREPEPMASEAKRLEAQVQASLGDTEIAVTLVLEERPDHIVPQDVTDEEIQ